MSYVDVGLDSRTPEAARQPSTGQPRNHQRGVYVPDLALGGNEIPLALTIPLHTYS